MTSPDIAERSDTLPSRPGAEWWRTAVIYQIYPRSFADSSGDGVGDLPGVTAHLDDLVELGVDALWLSPFQRSPQKDAGYDVADYCDVDPLFGTLGDFDDMLDAAHGRGIRIIVDLVPNHSSDQHVWFQAALAAGPGSRERARYLFREGKGKHGELPPNNWESVFGGPAWTRVIEADGTPGQWYLHLFDSTQPDFDWSNEEVREEFRRVLRFWLDRGVDGFRVDVAHGLIKAPGFPTTRPPPTPTRWAAKSPTCPTGVSPACTTSTATGTGILDEYAGDRALCAEAWRPNADDTALWVRPDEMHQAFNFPYLQTEWDAAELRTVITESLRAFSAVGAPSTWVLSNHDVVRHASRLALTAVEPARTRHRSEVRRQADPRGRPRRARAAPAVMLALPGSAYIYQGEELGLPEAVDLPDEARQDPTWFRTDRERYGRDGCRVPIPWSATSSGVRVQPDRHRLAAAARPVGLARPRRAARRPRLDALALPRHARGRVASTRSARGRSSGSRASRPGVLAFRNGHVTVVANIGSTPIALPHGNVIATSGPIIGGNCPSTPRSGSSDDGA